MAVEDITGKVLWLRNSSLGAAGSLAGWSDSSGTARTTSLLGAAPTVTAAATPNGKKAVTFSGTGRGISSARSDTPAISASSSYDAVTYAPWKAADSDNATYWHSATTSMPQWWQVNFTTAGVVTGYTVRPVNGSSSGPGTFKFQGSNDGSAWTDLDSQTGLTWTAAQSRTFTISNTNAYLYYRLYVTSAPDGYLRIGTISFDGYPISVAASSYNRDGELWAVVKSAASVASNNGGAFGSGTSGQSTHYGYSGQVYDDTGVTTRASFTPTLSIDTWRIVRVVVSGTTKTFYIDGVLQSTSTGVTRGWSDEIRVGESLTATPFGGQIAEVLVFDHALTSGDATTVTDYLTAELFTTSSAVTVAAPALALTVDALDPTVSVAVPAVTVSAPALALTLDALDPTVSAVTPQSVAAPGLALGVDVLDPTVSVAASAVSVAAPVLSLAVDVAAPTVDAVALEAGVWRDSAVAFERWVSAPVIAPPSERTRWVEAAVCDESMEFAPRAVSTPPALEVAPVKRLGMKMPAMSASYRHPVPFEGGFDIERGDVGRLQTIIGGRNFTFARNIPTTLDRFASEGPMCDTQATVRLPLDPWDEIGADDLAEIREDAQVDVILVRPDGTVEYKWEGFVSAHDDNTDESGEDYTIQCEGLFMQAAHWPWDVPVVSELRDVGHVVADALNGVPNRRWRKVPRVTTGILTSERGQQGWSTWQFVQTVLGKAWTDDGRQWSLERVARRTYRIVLKASTVAPTFTITKGAPGVGVSLRRDFSTRRDAIFARGYAPDGGYWCGRVFPSLDFGTPPRYPFNNASLNITVGTRDRDTDTGNGVTLWQRRMRELGYPVTIDGVMNSADTKWVYRVQRDKGITVDGSLGPQTWNATFEDNSHDADLTTYRVPLAFDADVWPWTYTASGARTLKTDRDTSVILHAMPEVDWGTDIRKTSAIEPTRRMLEREGTPGWTGTVTLRSDPWEAGSSRLDIREGHNLLILGHYGGTVVQVASADHQDDASVFTVDTKARDAMSLDAIRDRDREARRDAAGRGRTNDRSALNNAQVVQYESESKAGFVSRTAVNGNSGLWSVRKAFVSQVGVAKVEFDAMWPKAEVVAAIFNRPIRTSILATLVPDPLADDGDWYDNEQVLREKYGLMEILGSTGNPGGYSPKQKGKGPLTGKLRDEAGLPYDSPYGGFVWVALFTSRSTWVEGRIFPAVPQ